MSGKSNVIGPSLPPGFGPHVSDEEEDMQEECHVPQVAIIGPALPPGLISKTLTQESDSDEDNNVSSPKKRRTTTSPGPGECPVGPALPPGFSNTQDTDSESDSDLPSTKRLKKSESVDKESTSKDCVQSEPVYIGPTLPPGFKTKEPITQVEPNLYGPPLPPNFKAPKKSKKVIGPALPPGFTLPCVTQDPQDDGESSEEEYIGPSLTEYHSLEKNDDSVSKTVEARAKKMKDKLLHKEEESAPKREDWMLQLPDILGKKIGLGARTFSKKTGPSASELDRSGWTETPNDREKKEKQLEEQPEEDWKPTLEEVATHSRNLNIKSKIDEFNQTKRKESLLDIHQKNLKKKLKEDKEKGKKEKRREFDRDKDLNIQKLDKDGANNIIARSKVFNSKFSHGSNHFL